MNITEKLSKLLLSTENYKAENTDEQKVLNKTLVSTLAREYNAELLTLLQSDEEIKSHFFVKINETTIFKLENFLTFINNREFLPDSFTAYKNRIGLATNKDNYLYNDDKVVLNWAYKDCVLEGGQTKDDQKRKEIFFNEILAPDQINRLLDDKVFTNFKRYDKDGEHEVSELKTNDNLIIKGNNLVVLHSLKKRFAGKVKLIYIDPPYNTGNDSFRYNDNFNHSTWLTFMKNRLTVAKELLRDDGVIFVQCDDNEQAYLKVLMDEVFTNGFVSTISVQSSTPSGVKISHATKKILKSTDFILVYKRNETSFFPQYIRKEKWDTHYMFYIENNLVRKLKDVLIERKILMDNETLKDFNINKFTHKNFYIENGENIVRKSTHDNHGIKTICNSSEWQNKIYQANDNIYYGNDMLQPISKSFQPVFIGQNIEKDISNLVCDFWHDIDFQNTQNQGGVSFPAGKKPEQLLHRILSLTTQENDIVLDYHLGSGTTCAVAHKMNRQYIGIEQLNYDENDSVVRMQNVINGEQGGISKSVNYGGGGGEFVYCELKNDTEDFRNEVENAKIEELPNLLEKAKQSSFLSYRVDREKFNGFENLTKQEQRQLLYELVDVNTLYVNYSDLEDKDYDISEEDKKLNRQFYGQE
ncbi:MAG: site-specific DNA-methyltransferase [Campylobacteraceae bacterium]|nr:site-specific DNA-methyltransferase [Campylobacteraceae bacterium]